VETVAFNAKRHLNRKTCDGFPRSQWCGAYSVSRQRGAIPSRHGLATKLVEVPRCAECAGSRASALALPPRATAPHGRFPTQSPMKSVYRHTENGEKKSPLRLFAHTALHAPNGRVKPDAHPQKVQCLATSNRLWRRRSLVGGHRVFRCVLRWGRFFGG